MSFPSGYRRIVVDEKVYFWKVGDKFTEVRLANKATPPPSGRKKLVLANWTVLGMTKTEYLTNRFTRGSDEFRVERGCQCWRCDCDMPHLRSSHVVTPGRLAPAIRSNFS